MNRDFKLVLSPTWSCGREDQRAEHIFERRPFLQGIERRVSLVTTSHASWRIGQQRSSPTPVCHWPASGWCPSCGSCSSFPIPEFFARLSSVDHASAFPLGPVDCKRGDGVGILSQYVPNPAPSLSGDDGLYILSPSSCGRPPLDV